MPGHNSKYIIEPYSIIISIRFFESITIRKQAHNKPLASTWKRYEIYKFITNYGTKHLLNKKEDLHRAGGAWPWALPPTWCGVRV